MREWLVMGSVAVPIGLALVGLAVVLDSVVLGALGGSVTGTGFSWWVIAALSVDWEKRKAP